MTLGTRLGPYEVLSLLGAGGMGEVYRAKDSKLKREVALKVLPADVAKDRERLARFQREAEVLASLNHPHIAQIYGLEQAGDTFALVMELVEGEDLAQRIARGPVPLDEALPIARQIAEALEAAHEQGIIHRDLKPANVKVRADGTVKVLDFGLAKAMAPAGAAGANAMNSPTLSIHATEAGLILGTAAYMSPEQAAGKAVDKRSDLWAFGVVLLEMLTGRQVFAGETVSHVLAAVLRAEPDWSALPANTPPPIRRLLRRCLDKDRKRRLDSVADARLEIDDALTPIGETGTVSESTQGAAWRRALPWAVAAAGLVVAAVAITLWVPWRKASPPAPLRLSTELGADVSLTVGLGDATSLSPDGAVIAFVAQKSGGGSPQLYVRRLTQLQATPLSGTDDAESPFFSPDGQWIAFFAGGKLKKIAVTGGATVTLCDAPDDRGGAWGEDGTIVFLPNTRGSLMRVSSAGGTPEPLTSLAEGEATQRWPQVLPGGKAVLFTSSGATVAYDDANLVVQALPTGARTVVQRGGYHGRYLPSGHLVYLHAGTLVAAPFDLERLAVTGPPVPALEGVTSNADTGGAQFAVSASGTLVYLPGHSTGSGLPIHWMDHEGKTPPLRATPANWSNLLFAPDGRRLAIQILERSTNDIWVYEWARDTLTRLTFDPANDLKPVWTPDGRRLVFASARADQAMPNLYWQRADGTGDAQRLTESKNLQWPASWHPSGTVLAFEEQTPQTATDLMILPLEGDEASGWKPGKPTVFLNSPFTEREPMFSPDGRWLAYISNEFGRPEVYVRPFPGPGGKWQISTGGGSYPTWSQTKRELFYGTPNGQIMVAPYAVEGDSFRAEKPRLWSEGRHVVRGLTRMFDLHPDGERVALAPAAQTSGVKQDHVTFLFNFFDELRRIAPVTKP
ncbi:MAG: protein kinase [Acidobacteriota bacterium]|nr:protein kinase [Acidobacteriota bacterium]